MARIDQDVTLGELADRQKAVQKELEEARRGMAEQQLASNLGSRRSRRWDQPVLAAAEEEESWLTTYLDMMTLLLVLMIVMLSFAGKRAQSDAGTAQGGATTVAQAGAAGAGAGLMPAGAGLLPESGKAVGQGGQDHGLQLDGLGDDIDVVVNDQSISFRINSEILFSSGGADLGLEGLAVLRKLVAVLNTSPHQIVIEGHTDSVPIRSYRYPSNWELSGARAGSVVRYLESNGVLSQRLSAVGYADTRPLGDNGTSEGRASNRRVELILLTPPKEQGAQPQPQPQP
ncbi:OmpA/MotB family protein [Alcaligenes sp. SDU_A2]|uniref:OmpA/MotB family protein n=1 Tax=Alcaligenes sp. SDU_A2 TaxID=3136634 RepID=UPI00311F471D